MSTSRILIVEDDAILASHLEEMLIQLGYQATGLAATGKEAVKAALTQQPDAILMDIRLRGEMTGIQAAELIHKKADIPVVFLTAYTDEILLQQAKITDAYAYLVKPVRDREIRATLEMALYKHAAEEKVQQLNDVLRAVHSVNQLITHEKNAQKLTNQTCRILVQTRGYRMVWIGKTREEDKTVQVQACAGQGVDYLEAVTITWDDSARGRGPVGIALRTRKPAACNDIAGDPAYKPWRKAALARGFASSAAVPVAHGRDLYGVLCVYADRPGMFQEKEVALLRELAGDLGFAFHSLRQKVERLKVDEALRESRERFRSLYENATIGLFRTTPDGRILMGNPTTQRSLGYRSFKELASRDLEKEGFDPKYLRSEFRERLERGGVINGLESRWARKDGSFIYVRESARAVRDKNGKTLYYDGTFEDITERKQAEEKLRRMVERWSIVYRADAEISASLDLEQVFAAVHRAVKQVMPCEDFVISLYDETRNVMEGNYIMENDKRVPPNPYQADHGMGGHIVHTGQSLILNSPGQIKTCGIKFEPFGSGLATASIVAVPLQLKRKNIGILSAQSYHSEAYTIEDQEMLEMLASHAVVAIDNARLFEQAQQEISERKQAGEEICRRVADLEALYENSLSISVLLEPKRIAERMIEILSQKLEWFHASIRLYHPETKRMELLALSEPGLDPTRIQVEIDRLNKVFTSPNMGLSGWVIKHGRAIRIGDVQKDKRYFSAFPNIRSGLYVPLMIGERAVGSIAVESRQANRFSKEDERLLQTLAAQSAIAFENTRLYQDAVNASKRKAALHQGSLEIVRAGQDVEALCIALHHAAQQVMPAEAFTVSLITEDGREVETPNLYDRGVRHPNTKQPVKAGITGRVLKSKKPLLVKDIQKSRGVKPIIVDGSKPTRAVLSVPLLAQDKIIGVISAQSETPDVYSAEDQTFMETLASEAAIAFENARLFGDIRRRLTELENLSQVSTSLTSVIDLQPLLENILAGARNAIPAAEKGTVFLVEPDNVLRLYAMAGYADPRLINLALWDQKGYAARVAREQSPIKIDDAHAEYETPAHGGIEEVDAVQSGIAAPLIMKGKVIGVISLDNSSRKAAFSESDLRLLVTFASSVAVAIENARLFTETQQRLHRLSVLHSIDAAIGASVDLSVTLSIVLENIMTELKADAAAVLLFNPLTRVLEYAAGRGFRAHTIEGVHLRLGDGLAGLSALQRRAINIADLQQADEVERVMMEHPVSGSAPPPLQYLEGENFVSYHAIPMIAKGQIQGVLEIFRRTPMQVDQEWINFFEMLAGQTAIAIESGRLFEGLQNLNLELTLAYDDTIQGWSQALELRDEETEGHTRRVTDLTLNLIQAMGIEDAETEHARRGALLHDIGKIAVPDSVLLKPGPLDEREWNVMRQHPQYAYNLLFPITYLRPAIHIPYCHHEKWDGSGYPRGLKGEEIPMVARIFAVVDVYDALTSNRPYRLAWTRGKALEYIREQSGKHFDPRVVKAFMDLKGEKK